MNIPTDLRTTRIQKGLRLSDLASGMLREATLSEAEQGKRLPRLKTRMKIESILGPIDWAATLAGPDRQHIIFALSEFVNIDGPGDPRQRIAFAKQSLQLIEQSL